MMMMEKQNKAKNKILKFFPKVLSFQNPPFSPSREKDAPSRSNTRFSGPIVSIIPREARRTKDTPQEPTSPKVSCFGQIKQRHSKKKLIEKEEPNWRSRLLSKESKKNRKKKDDEERMSVEGNAPALGQMRRFASSRGSLSNFDWMAQVAPEEEEEEEEEVEMDRIAFSAPLVAGGVGEMGLKPKKEINLWKRRTMEPPRPLNLGPQSDS